MAIPNLFWIFYFRSCAHSEVLQDLKVDFVARIVCDLISLDQLGESAKAVNIFIEVSVGRKYCS